MPRVLLIKVFPESGAEQVVGDGKKLRVYVREPAQNGLANRAGCLAISRHLGVGQEQVVITRGHRTPNKTVVVHGVE